MKLVTLPSEVEANIRLLRSYLAGGNGADADFARALIERGICFIVVRHLGSDFFAPSRFIGYVGNSQKHHLKNAKDGRDTNWALTKITGSEPKANRALEKAYRALCAK